MSHRVNMWVPPFLISPHNFDHPISFLNITIFSLCLLCFIYISQTGKYDLSYYMSNMFFVFLCSYCLSWSNVLVYLHRQMWEPFHLLRGFTGNLENLKYKSSNISVIINQLYPFRYVIALLSLYKYFTHF